MMTSRACVGQGHFSGPLVAINRSVVDDVEEELEVGGEIVDDFLRSSN